MKKNFLVLLVFCILILIWLVSLPFSYNDRKKNDAFLFNNLKNFEFYDNYSKKLHHLRDTKIYGNEDPSNYIFSVINKNSSNNYNILLQGDSWFEQINDTYLRSGKPISFELYSKFSKELKISLINAGTSSYSPSLFHAQYEILEKDFNIKPDIVVIYIDQADVYDENCRYKQNKNIYNNYVSREFYSTKIYDLTKTLEYSRIELTTNSSLIKNIKNNNFFIKYTILSSINILKNSYFKNKKLYQYRCYYRGLYENYIDPDKKNIDYFIKVLNKYLKFLENKKYVDKIILVTFPHIQNYKNIYKFEVGEIIAKNAISSNKIEHIDFFKIISLNKKLKKLKMSQVYEAEDVFSHINSWAHAEIFTKYIIDRLRNILS